MKVSECDILKTAFCVPGSGLWQFNVMLCGAINSPAVFERLIERVFVGLKCVTLLIYLDDTTVYGETFRIHLHKG